MNVPSSLLVCAALMASLLAAPALAQNPPLMSANKSPSADGIPYHWNVTLSRGQKVEHQFSAGAKSWHEPSNPTGLKGWAHTCSWVLLELREPSIVKIRVVRQQGVLKSDGSYVLNRDRFYPALSIFSGHDTDSSQDHTFNNSGNFWSTVNYLGNHPNLIGAEKIVYKIVLAAGKYTIAIGGNPPSLGSPSNYPATNCNPTDPTCYTYTGFHGYRAMIRAR